MAVLAEEQHAVIEYGQLRQLGLGLGAIKHRARTGRLHRLYQGVYAVGHKTVSRKGDWMAAVFACGPDALLSHRSAAALWNLLPDRRAAIDVTVPRSRCGSGPIVVHNVRHLHPADRQRVDGIAVTSVARVLLDLAETVPPRQLARAIDEAERLALFDLRAIEELCRRSRGRRGVRPLREAFRRYRPSPPMTRSQLERRFAKICDHVGVPRPGMNLFVAGHEVDATWCAGWLVVEVDSFEFHRTLAAFEADRRRDADLQLAGFRVLRVTERRINEDPEGIGEDIKALLSLVPIGRGRAAR